LAGIGFTRATPLVAGFLAGTPGTALVGAALFVLEPLYLAPRAISLTLLPSLSFASAAGNRTESGEVVRISTGITALLTAPFCTILILERDRVLQVIFSDEIVGGATLAWFSAAFLVSVIGAPAITALAAVRVRAAAIPMWSSLVGFLIATIVWVTVGRREGTVAVAIGYLVGSIVQVAYPLVAATRLYRIRWKAFWIRVVALAAALIGASRFPPSIYLDFASVGLILLVLYPETRRFLQQVRKRLVR
jgi:O-antigen/teichoic acid export membrane protein